MPYAMLTQMPAERGSAFGMGLEMLNQDICTLYDSIAVYASYGGIVFAEEEGRNIAKALGEKNKVLMLLSLSPMSFEFELMGHSLGRYPP